MEPFKPLVTIELSEYNALLKSIKVLDDCFDESHKKALDEIVEYFQRNYNPFSYGNGRIEAREFIDDVLKRHNLAFQIDPHTGKAVTFINNLYVGHNRGY